MNNKVYSALNILGLAIGMAVALLIGLWVNYQISYDRFLPGYKSLYQVRYKTDNNGIIQTQISTALPLADAMKRDVPGIRHIVRTDWMGTHGLMAGDRKIYIAGGIAESDFLKMFRYPFIKGNADEAMKDPYSIVLTQSTAKALFGNEEAMNKTVRFDNSHDLKVTGILKDLPHNSNFAFNFLVPFSYWQAENEWVRNNMRDWGNNSFQTFVELQPNSSYTQVEPHIRGLLQKYSPKIYKPSKAEVFMQPLKDWHLYTDFKNGVAVGGFIDYVKMFSIIGILVLLIACINFMNLSTARSEKRAREVGIRKAIGSQRRDLIVQFLTESLVITFIAFLFSLILVSLVLPAFNALTNTSISIPYGNVFFWLIMLSYVLLTGLLAGSRPAFYLSSFNPVKVLKGTIQAGRSASLPRKILVVLQFSCSIALIISTIIIYQQIQHARNRPIGYNTNNLLMTDNSSDLQKNYAALKHDLLQSGLVTGVTKASSPATDIWSFNHVDEWQGKLPGELLGGMATISVSDTDYFKTLGMQLTAGRNFYGNEAADSLSLILNEAAVKRLRFKEPLNQNITWAFGKQRVIGVVKDALMISPYSPAEPTFFVFIPGWANSISYRLANGVNTHEAIAKLGPVFNKYNPAYPYLYKFVDESYAGKFALEELIGKLAGLFAALAILISCLGLFGLAAYMAEQRTKEIGIRKVLGASVSQLWLLLSKDFIVLVLLSCIIASPVAFYFLKNWLTKYDYRITIGVGVFVLSAFIAVLITIITISFQAIKAAMMNPARTLKTE